jgi:hypothetical protein
VEPGCRAHGAEGIPAAQSGSLGRAWDMWIFQKTLNLTLAHTRPLPIKTKKGFILLVYELDCSHLADGRSHSNLMHTCHAPQKKRTLLTSSWPQANDNSFFRIISKCTICHSSHA